MYTMKVQTAKQMIRLQEWGRQIHECQQSGKSVKQWCAEQGLNRKTYYWRLRVLQEAMLEAWETNGIVQQQVRGDSKGFHHIAQWGAVQEIASHPVRKEHVPVFAALPALAVQEVAVTVRIGEYAVDIHADADEKIIEQVLRAVTQL